MSRSGGGVVRLAGGSLAAGVVVLGGALVAAAAGGGWIPPRGGAAAMFRQMERAFAPGGRSGGAGRQPGADWTPEHTRSAPPGSGERIRVELVPMQWWDSPGGPLGHELEVGTVRFYRRGAYEPELTAALGEDVQVPPGDWYVMGEAPGFVTVVTQRVTSSPWQAGGGSVTLPVVPACRLRWQGEVTYDVQRVDVVSISQAAVYPLHLGVRREAWVPEGDYLVSTIGRSGGVLSIGSVESCDAGATKGLTLPPQLDTEHWGLMLSLDVGAAPSVGGGAVSHRATATRETSGGGMVTVRPTATLRQGRWLYLFFARLPTVPVELSFDEPTDLPPDLSWPPLPGKVREVVVCPGG